VNGRLRRTRPAAVLAGALVVVAGGVALAASVGTWGPAAALAESHRTAAVASRPVTDALLVCPAVPGASDAARTVVAAGAPPGGTGALTLSRLGHPSQVLVTAREGSSLLRTVTRRNGGGALVVHGTGDLARGLTATATTRTSLGRGRSLSTLACTAPGPETWFVGGGATVGRRSVLYLSDADTADAIVDVTVWTARGQVQPTSVQGLTVPAGRVVAVPLDTLVPGAPAAAVRVRARSGRVASALFDSAVTGLVPGGAEWVPPSVEPAEHLVVTGVPGDAGTVRRLSLLVPGTDDAQVRVRLATPQGTLSPQSLGSLLVPGGRLLTIDLGKTRVSGPYAVLVDSDHPLVAGVRAVQSPQGELPDFTYGAAAAPVVGGAVMVPRADRSAGVVTRLQLTDPGNDDATVRLTTYVPPGTNPTSRTVVVPAGRSIEVPVGVTGKTVAVLVETTAPDLVVGWVQTEAGARGPLVTSGPVLQTPLTTPVPPVAPDPAAGYPGH